MAGLKIFLLLIFSFSSVLSDEYHQKANRKLSKMEYQNIDPILKELEGYNEFWSEKAQKILEDQLKIAMNTKKAKNIILFIGDGLSIATTSATRMYLGGEEKKLSYENFPYVGLARTYCVDHQVSSSSCAANALMHGVKNNRRGIGVNANVLSSQCHFEESDRTYSIASWAQKQGKATGLVTNTRVTHATPASVYAHVSERDWESDSQISEECLHDPNNSNVDIAYQMVYNDEAKPLKVILGCGRRNFINSTMNDDETRPGRRTDGRNLIDEWLDERNKEGNAKYIWHNQQLEELDIENTDYLLGLFESDHCMYRQDILENNLRSQEPLLTDMTRAAIKMLQKEENGFFLMVEGGRIDMAHHENWARKALDETAEFARAVEIARTLTNEEDTLIIVSSDHSHVFTYNGYPARHSNVLSFNKTMDDGLPYEILSYANGPGFYRTYEGPGRSDLRNDDFSDINRQYSATVPLESESHGGEDIQIYANGPFSHLFQGSFEQNVVGLSMAYAAGIGPYNEEDTPSTSSSSPTQSEASSSTEIPATTPNSSSSLILLPSFIFMSLIFSKILQ